MGFERPDMGAIARSRELTPDQKLKLYSFIMTEGELTHSGWLACCGGGDHWHKCWVDVVQTKGEHEHITWHRECACGFTWRERFKLPKLVTFDKLLEQAVHAAPDRRARWKAID